MVIFTRESVEGKCFPGAVQAPPCPQRGAESLPLVTHPGGALHKQQLKTNKEPSWFAVFIYLRTAVRGELHSSTWVVCGLGLNFSGASHLLPADASLCLRSRSNLHKIYGWILYRFYTIARVLLFAGKC